MELIKSPVFFDKIEHKYWLDGVELRGITGMLHNQLFPSMYASVDAETLKHAAERGTRIHELCEAADKSGKIELCNEVINYMDLTKDMVHVESEYLVSDLKHYASCIDKVFKVEGSENEYILADIKTTSKLNVEYVSWQLSIYAYLFEMQNPDAKVTKLYGIWLRDDKCKMQEVGRVADEEVEKLLQAEVEGFQYVTPYNLPEEWQAVQMEVANWYAVREEAEAKIKTFEAKMKELMEQSNCTKFESAKFLVTRKADYTRKSLDSKALKEAHPDIYKEYEKETTCKGGVSIKIKD